MAKRVLVLGGTGAMGRYAVPELLRLGYKVDVASLDEAVSNNPMLTYRRVNVKNEGILDSLLKNDYDGIIDFMSYSTEEFKETYTKLLENTDHYIFLSSCRVYADNPPIREDSPRLLDVSRDAAFLATDDYALFKAREEDILKGSAYKNWTIVRPATTYSTGRFQLVTLEASTLIHRMQTGKTIVLPEAAMNCQATLSWGGDVGVMIARILFNEKALGESYITATAEHHSWQEIADIYHKIIPFKYVTVSIDDYLDIIAGGADYARYQLIYARMFQRITDNSKILALTGMEQSKLMPLADGLKLEYGHSGHIDFSVFANDDRNTRMDAYLQRHNL